MATQVNVDESSTALSKTSSPSLEVPRDASKYSRFPPLPANPRPFSRQASSSQLSDDVCLASIDVRLVHRFDNIPLEEGRQIGKLDRRLRCSGDHRDHARRDEAPTSETITLSIPALAARSTSDASTTCDRTRNKVTGIQLVS
eukprot:CAMPEP_0118917284 /NCGR_PEP_ID=MMETSP1166-20130328/17200_1 /TAXON_ID=1104430 /ORGANISM="Chrysoreinhardia sp, Strain CCMP3193" /LENGTH=142 /DNA_ID=CAMNT_0006857401 /DNA_START=225 /DNA_END=658 /DNA_ORIENTATION=-